MEGIDFLSALVELETFWRALTLKSCEMKTFLFGPGDKIKKNHPDKEGVFVHAKST